MGSITNNDWRDFKESATGGTMPTIQERIENCTDRIGQLEDLRTAYVNLSTLHFNLDIEDVGAIDIHDNRTRVLNRFEQRIEVISGVIRRLEKRIATLGLEKQLRAAMQRASNGSATQQDMELLAMTLAEHLSGLER